jgi:hypothetical protein
MSSICRDGTALSRRPGAPCENILSGFPGGPNGAARAADAAPCRRSRWRSVPAGPTPVGWPERRRIGAAEAQAVTKAAADLTREPSRRPHRAHASRPEASPIRQQAYGPPPLVKSAAPSVSTLPAPDRLMLSAEVFTRLAGGVR